MRPLGAGSSSMPARTGEKLLLQKFESQRDVDSFVDEIKEEARIVVTGLGSPIPGLNEKHREMAAFVLLSGEEDGEGAPGQFVHPEKKRLDPVVAEAKDLIQKAGYIVNGDVSVPLKAIPEINNLGTSYFLGQSGGQNMTGEEVNSIQKKLFSIYTSAARAGASDIHIDTLPEGCAINFRIYGQIRNYSHETFAVGQQLCHVAAILATEGDPHYEPGKFQDKNMRPGEYTLPHGIQSLRLHWNPGSNGARQCVIRLNKEPRRIRPEDKPFLKAGFTPDHDDAFARFRQKKSGLLILSGPTGSGKTTTLTMNATVLYFERETRIAINTLEDPVEQPILGAFQTSVPSSEYRVGLKAMVRSDPDVIIVSEMRDQESSDQAIHASRTGHLMMSTTHCDHAITIPSRIMDMGVDKMNALDASIMKMWVSQRLVGVLCPHCSIPYTEGVKKGLRSQFECESVQNIIPEEYFPNLRMINPVMSEKMLGCGKKGCRYGQSGATIIAEVIEPDKTFIKYLRDMETEKAEQYWLDDLGGMLLEEHAMLKTAFGIIDPQELLGVSENPGALKKDRILTLLKDKGEKWFGSVISKDKLEEGSTREKASRS